ncbi:DNA/RNA helicase domain-containing protein [Sporosarcina sp. UB5]|uniref:DNA/RNA helicase domain-containing protein n=1 Tax=Sporosarcina sp. UB5 TaxID=3047463 RepID=UPI003D792BFF
MCARVVGNMKNVCLDCRSEDFFRLSIQDFMEEMKTSYLQICREEPSDLQQQAWIDSFHILQNHLPLLQDYPIHMIFEYVLPHEGGRRPDLLLVSDSEVLVIEFKEKATIQQADVDQVSAYARDLKHYHFESRNRKVTPYLVPTKARSKRALFSDVIAISPDLLFEDIQSFCRNANSHDSNQWIHSKYEPLPSIVEAAKMIYTNKHLPSIHRANSSGLPDALRELRTIAEATEATNKKALVLVTGVPGAGKTLLGLQYVYESSLQNQQHLGVFLSGNGPLVQVLQDALESKAFIQPLRNFISFYGRNYSQIPQQRIIVFDEAQRAWDREQVKEKHDHDYSEPELLVQVADRIDGWTVVLGLVGEGQEIYVGEEAGIGQWMDAISKSRSEWDVFVPSKLATTFEGYNGTVTYKDELNLSITLRSHIAEDVSQWASELLEGSLDLAQDLLNKIYGQHFNIYVTRDLDKAKRYVWNRYNEDSSKRYGLIASSRSKLLPHFGVDTSYKGTASVNIAKWYNDDPTSKDSGCSLTKVATEFSCQGLELDFPIVCWGEDVVWNNGSWISTENSNPRIRNSHLLRINSYRVLLTRARDGMIIYVPKSDVLDETYNLLKLISINEL